ncbi:MAG TPA: hypothetical protein VN193_08550 [Candidatus Angelobacter sp.]|jgi:hypothetical protein|nr:hypothetical protein [Candidatus Angelobacter sp.]
MIITQQPMPLRPTLRRRTSRRPRLAAAAVLACSLGGAAALLAAGTVVHAPAPLVVQAQVCVSPLSGLTCTPPPHTSGTSSPPHTTTPGKPPPTSTGGHPSSPPSTSGAQPSLDLQPSADALPTLPPPSPGTPPAPPELSVQSISLQVASARPARPGGTTLVQGTLEAQRGADTYSVPHANVVLTIASAPGHGANVIPAELDSGDTGVVLVTVVTGDQPGDTVIHAVSGNASADVTVHTDAVAAATATPSNLPVAVAPGGNSRSDTRGYLIASLAALIVALMAGYITALVMGRMPNPFQRRSVWGRRSR